jgi:hypothetical protein
LRGLGGGCVHVRPAADDPLQHGGQHQRGVDGRPGGRDRYELGTRVEGLDERRDERFLFGRLSAEVGEGGQEAHRVEQLLVR